MMGWSHWWLPMVASTGGSWSVPTTSGSRVRGKEEGVVLQQGGDSGTEEPKGGSI